MTNYHGKIINSLNNNVKCLFFNKEEESQDLYMQHIFLNFHQCY